MKIEHSQVPIQGSGVAAPTAEPARAQKAEGPGYLKKQRRAEVPAALDSFAFSDWVSPQSVKTLIGIGPKTAEALAKAGINSVGDLSRASAAQIDAIRLCTPRFRQKTVLELRRLARDFMRQPAIRKSWELATPWKLFDLFAAGTGKASSQVTSSLESLRRFVHFGGSSLRECEIDGLSRGLFGVAAESGDSSFKPGDRLELTRGGQSYRALVVAAQGPNDVRVMALGAPPAGDDVSGCELKLLTLTAEELGGAKLLAGQCA